MVVAGSILHLLCVRACVWASPWNCFIWLLPHFNLNISSLSPLFGKIKRPWNDPPCILVQHLSSHSICDDKETLQNCNESLEASLPCVFYVSCGYIELKEEVQSIIGFGILPSRLNVMSLLWPSLRDAVCQHSSLYCPAWLCHCLVCHPRLQGKHCCYWER